MAEITTRQAMPQQKPEKRKYNFSEVSLGYDEATARIEASRCLQCKNPDCVGGCPVKIDIPRFLKSIEEGKFLEAISVIKEANSLPAVCGRVCPQENQCEAQCILGKKHEAVAIGRLEMFAADYERVKVNLPEKHLSEFKSGRIAVIGAGPAGLSASGDLARQGYDVTVFEGLHWPGGVLTYGIPEFRLPKNIVDYEIECLKKTGVKIVTNRVIGISESIDDLFEAGYDAIFISSGAGLPLFLNLEGENLRGVYSANEYLTRINLMKAYRFPEYDTPVIKGKRIGVIGGGNVAMDAARCAIRLDSKEVHLIYRRSLEEIPARAEEVHHAMEEGVNFNILSNPLRFLGDEDGNLIAVECQGMALGEPDGSGRRRPEPVEGSEFIMDIDVAIVAIGNSPNPIIQRSSPDIRTTKTGTIVVDEDFRTVKQGVFAGGDIVSGAATVIEAMGAGRKAAKSISRYLNERLA